MPDGKADLWWLQLESLSNGNAEWFEKTMAQIYGRHEHIATTMHELTSSDANLELGRQLSLTWEQIQLMATEGLCTVGSHGVSHSALSLLPEEEAFQELVASKQRLEKRLNLEVKHFSYPHSLFNDATQKLVRKAGYATAVIGYGGVVRRNKKNTFFSRNFIVQP